METFPNHQTGEGRLAALRIVRNPRESFWKLRRLEPNAGIVALLGWVMTAPAIDAGVPEPVAGILTRALCRSGNLTFLNSAALEQDCRENWRKIPSGWARVLESNSRRLPGRKPVFPLQCTADPEGAAGLFYTPQFPWELRGQVVILSLPGLPPAISYEWLSNVLERDTIEYSRGAESSPFGLMLPGVDGDFAELIVFDEAMYSRTHEQLNEECVRSGVSLQVVSETEFRSTDWFSETGS